MANPPVVALALWYRVGSRDEAVGAGGLSHFLEHMMFKGSGRFGPGEVDRLVQSAGGSGNAYTSHDATVYAVQLPADRWRVALAYEADRMVALTLDQEEIERERLVIREEIAMYEDDPWSALEQAVLARRYGGHPYARPVLGTAAEVAVLDRETLDLHHRRWYRPGNAVLVVAGAVTEADLETAAEAFRGVPAGALPMRTRESVEVGTPRSDRVLLPRGEIRRFFLALPAPPADGDDTPALRLIGYLLTAGRTSRLHRRLVEEEELCLWVTAEVSESRGPGTFTVAAELHPGAEPERVEAAVREEFEAVGAGELSAVELGRSRRAMEADWVFGHERAEDVAMTVGLDLAIFEEGHSRRSLERALAADPDQLGKAARRYLGAPHQIIGWSMEQ